MRYCSFHVYFVYFYFGVHVFKTLSHFHQIVHAHKVKVTGATNSGKAQTWNILTIDCTPAGTATLMNIIFW